MKISDLIELMRPFTLLAPFAAILAGALAAASVAGIPIDAVAASILVGAVSASLLNAASNSFNQACDVTADKINKPERPIPLGRVSVHEATLFAGLLYIVALGLALTINLAFFVLAGIAALITIFYSAHFVRLKKYGWFANASVAVSRGVLVLVAGWSIVAFPSSLAPWFMGGIFGLFLLGATTTKDFADVAGDKKEGLRTLPIKYGMKGAAKRIAPFLILPFLLFPVGAVLGILPAAAFFLGILSLWGAYAAHLILKNPNELALKRNHPSWMHMYLLMVCTYAGIVISYWI